MNSRIFLVVLVGLLLSLVQQGFAQTAKLSAADSMKAARKHYTDSMAAVRAYKASKRYRDSVARVRKAHTDSIKMVREQRLDSMREIREKNADSLATVRKQHADSVQEMQEERAEQAQARERYKLSKRYADSVAIVKRTRTDSIKKAQKVVSDQAAKVRKGAIDSMKAAIKHTNDSLKMVRTKSMDSLKIVRKHRQDSLAKIRNSRDKTVKVKEKQTEEKKKIALELKMKAKREAFTNKDMLKKKWTPVRAFFQNGFTHYNYYYNANRKMEEAKANMLRGITREHYDSLIRLYPFDPDTDSSMLAADMDSIIRRVSVGLQIHDPRVKWANDLYLIMGEAYFYKGQYENAAATFKYIINSDEEQKKKEGGTKGKATSVVEEKKSRLDFLKHKSVHNDAILWLAQTFVQAKQVENGQAVLSMLASDSHTPEDMVGKIAAGKAFAFLADKNYTAAATELQTMMEDDYLPNWLRMRAAFLNGQIQQQAENYVGAIQSFERCLDFFPKIEMDFMARKFIAYNTLMAGKDLATGIKPLKKILNDGKYASYYDQIYFVLGRTAARANKPDDAITYLDKSAHTPKASKSQKVISFAELGDVYYKMGNYRAAKSAYDSAAKYAGPGAAKDPALAATMQRNKGLAEIAEPLNTIREQDSLLELAAMSKKEQQSVARHYISMLERAMRDSIKKAKESGLEDATPAAPEADNSPALANWYFSNPVTMQQGAVEFKRKWGNRPLTDNWRRGAVAAAAAGGNVASNVPEETSETTTKETPLNGLPTEESLIARLPSSPEQKKAAYSKIQKAYITLATGYLKQLDDYVQSGKTLDTLNARFPDHPYKEDEMYLRYQLAMRQNKLADAMAISNQLLAKYPNSKYAAQLKPKEAKGQGGMPTVNEYYDETYTQLLQHKYPEVLRRVDSAKSQYDNPTFRKRFQIAEAQAYAGMGNYNQADTLLTAFIASNPGDTFVAWASNIAAYVKDVRANGVPTWYKNLPPPSPESGVTTTETKPVEPPKPPTPPKPKRPADVPFGYSYQPDEEHYCLLLLNSVDSRTIKLKRAIMSVDSAHGANNIVLIDMYSPVEVLVLVKSFAGAAAAKDFLEALSGAGVFEGYTATELVPMVVSASNYKKMFWEKDSSPYMSFYRNHY